MSLKVVGVSANFCVDLSFMASLFWRHSSTLFITAGYLRISVGLTPTSQRTYRFSLCNSSCPPINLFMYGQFLNSSKSSGSIFNASPSSGTFPFFIGGTSANGLDLFLMNTFGASSKYPLIYETKIFLELSLFSGTINLTFLFNNENPIITQLTAAFSFASLSQRNVL